MIGRKPRAINSVRQSPRMTIEPDPYQPGTPSYAERNRQTATQVFPTMTRVDLGEPVKLDPYK